MLYTESEPPIHESELKEHEDPVLMKLLIDRELSMDAESNDETLNLKRVAHRTDGHDPRFAVSRMDKALPKDIPRLTDAADSKRPNSRRETELLSINAPVADAREPNRLEEVIEIWPSKTARPIKDALLQSLAKLPIEREEPTKIESTADITA